jgi:hypothetical protein
MSDPNINPMALRFAWAAGFCYLAIAIAYQLVRKQVNDRRPEGERISWFRGAYLRSTVIAEYKIVRPQGWEYRAYQTFRVLWLVLVIAALLIFLLGPSA